MKALLTIAYDGTNYHGWQRQKGDPVPTVEQMLNEACFQIFRREVEIIGASRTDRGVHAMGQRAALDITGVSIPVDRLPAAINSKLPEDIAVRAAIEAADSFHPRFDCVKKTYEYRILNDSFRNPLLRNYTEFVYRPLSVDAMRGAAKAFVGRHDFKAFCAAGNSSSTTIRNIFEMSVKKEGNIIVISVTGDGFLYNMIRIIAGTLIDAGLGKTKPEDIADIIASRDRTRAGKTAGASGLMLKEIFY